MSKELLKIRILGDARNSCLHYHSRRPSEDSKVKKKVLSCGTFMYLCKVLIELLLGEATMSRYSLNCVHRGYRKG